MWEKECATRDATRRTVHEPRPRFGFPKWPSNVTPTGERLLVLRRLFDPDQSPLLRAAFAEVHHHGGFRLGQIGQAGFVDRFLLVADRPCGALRGLVHGAVDG